MFRVAFLLIAALSAAPSLAQSGAQRKVAVLPFQALSADLPSRIGPRLTARLAEELRSVEGLAYVEPAAPAVANPAEALTRARAAVKEASAAREARDFAGADAALGRALEAYAAGAANLDTPAELSEAFALRAAVRYALGRDAEAATALTQALSLSSGRAPALAATSPLFASTVERVRAVWEDQSQGALRIESLPPGVALSLDGRPLGNAPLRIRDVPPGLHLWRATLPSGDAVGGLVEVPPDQVVSLTVRPAGEGPHPILAAMLSNNRLDTAALDAATTLGRDAGADLVLLGTLSRDGSGLACDAFVLVPGERRPRRLSRLSLDAELLDASGPLRTLVTSLATRGADLGTPEPLPITSVSRTLPGPRAPTLGAYPPAPPDGAAKSPAPTAPRAPAAPAPIRKPLVRP